MADTMRQVTATSGVLRSLKTSMLLTSGGDSHATSSAWNAFFSASSTHSSFRTRAEIPSSQKPSPSGSPFRQQHTGCDVPTWQSWQPCLQSRGCILYCIANQAIQHGKNKQYKCLLKGGYLNAKQNIHVTRKYAVRVESDRWLPGDISGWRLWLSHSEAILTTRVRSPDQEVTLWV